MTNDEILNKFISNARSEKNKYAHTDEYNVERMTIYFPDENCSAITVQTTAMGPIIIRSYLAEGRYPDHQKFNITDDQYLQCKKEFLNK